VTRRIHPCSIHRDAAREIVHNRACEPHIVDPESEGSPAARGTGIPGLEKSTDTGTGRIYDEKPLPLSHLIDAGGALELGWISSTTMKGNQKGERPPH
jgi:hypothetical protein